MPKSQPPASPVNAADHAADVAPAPWRLCEAEGWIFDLDNTLYPAAINLYSQIDAHMQAYIAAYLGLEPTEARVVQKRYFHEYGTSLCGLMECHGMDPAPFLARVHDIDLSVLDADPLLERALAALPGRKVVFTNASVAHAERVMARLGIGHHFDGVFDIVAAGYRPKPKPEGYAALVREHGIDPRRSVMVEDIARNLQPAAALGMTTVWVRSDSEIGRLGADDGYVDYVVDDLAAWLRGCAERRLD
jgi:putative hydrolase of the HAD superfamily